MHRAWVILFLFVFLCSPASLSAASFNFSSIALPALEAPLFDNLLAQAPRAVNGLFESLRNTLSEVVNRLPKPAPAAPAPAQVSVEPSSPPSLEVLTLPPLPSLTERPASVASPLPAVSGSSVAARFAVIEAQMSRLRELISRQSDSNVRHAAQVVTETITVSAPGFDTAAAHNFTALQTFTNASSTLFSSQYASTTILCISDDCRTSWSAGGGASFTYPFVTLDGTAIQATSSVMNFNGGILTSASSTLASTTVTSLLSANATATNLYVGNLASSTETRANTGFIGFLTSVFGSFTNILATGSSTFQAFSGTSGTTTNFYTGNLLATASSTFQAFRGTSGTTTNFYTGNLLATASSTFQALFSTSATGTNLYATNFLALGSSTLQRFTGTHSTTTNATTTDFSATNATIGSALNFSGRATTTLTANSSSWVIATNTAATAYPLLSFNNSAGTSTIQFFGATTTGLTAGTGMGIPMGQFVLIGDGRTASGLNILKGGLCVDADGWCTATTSGRISSVSSFIGAADLAEMYQAGDYMEPGDVVAITSGITVIKATLGSKERMMGVVSTEPGIVLGTGPDAEGRAGDVPIALTGRVPVKVSAENGAIKPGDYLTLSSIAGVAARATKAGTTIGQALEGYSGSGVGKILTFVKNSYYSGLSLDNFPGLTAVGFSTPEALLIALENGAETSSAISSDLTADRMLAAVEIITPKVTTGLISAKVIESPTIEALSNRITTEIGTLRAELSGTNAALLSLTARVEALERASSTSSFSLASVAHAVEEVIAGAQEWVVGKITAAVGVFTKLCIGNTCIEEEQLIKLLNQSGQNATEPVVTPPADPLPDPALPEEEVPASLPEESSEEAEENVPTEPLPEESVAEPEGEPALEPSPETPEVEI